MKPSIAFFVGMICSLSFVLAMEMMYTDRFARLVSQDHREQLASEVDQVHSELKEISDRAQDSGRAAAIRAEMNAVHEKIFELQGALARTDARISAAAERRLIEMGLLSPRPGTRTESKVRNLIELTWPVSGRITAGYRDQDYARYFGVPHEGIDIAVPSGTSVKSAADGYVLYVQDKGDSSYSYVMIGHTSGTATLYGHLSEVGVEMGQYIKRGQSIGKSGGVPGSRGAGLRTTGAHLHLEVLQGGKHADPESVLP